jgi:hypothetical protein
VAAFPRLPMIYRRIPGPRGVQTKFKIITILDFFGTLSVTLFLNKNKTIDNALQN